MPRMNRRSSSLAINRVVNRRTMRRVFVGALRWGAKRPRTVRRTYRSAAPSRFYRRR